MNRARIIPVAAAVVLSLGGLIACSTSKPDGRLATPEPPVTVTSTGAATPQAPVTVTQAPKTATQAPRTVKQTPTSSRLRECGWSSGYQVMANPRTTCPFAMSVALSHFYDPASPTVDVWSEATRSWFRMTCLPANATVCTGGSGAEVVIR